MRKKWGKRAGLSAPPYDDRYDSGESRKSLTKPPPQPSPDATRSLFIENKYFSYIFRFSTPAAISNTFSAQQKHFSASQHENKAYFAIIIVLVPVQLLFSCIKVSVFPSERIEKLSLSLSAQLLS
jgi:hypothetical protein